MPEQDPAKGVTEIDGEVKAIATVLDVLRPLKDDQRSRVLTYVFARLGSPLPIAMHVPPAASASSGMAPPPSSGTSSATGRVSDIRSLTVEKKPRNSIEMAVVVAYYLAEVSSQQERKVEIGSDEIAKYFKQADFPLPGRAAKTLFDAKSAGYLDAGATRGTYKLNPVGHNLVAHNLPSSGSDARGNTVSRLKPRRAKSAKRAKKLAAR